MRVRSQRGAILVALAWAFALPMAPATGAAAAILTARVTPASAGVQLVRFSLPLPQGLLREGSRLSVSDGRSTVPSSTRVLTFHPQVRAAPRSARRALITFPYTFKSDAPVEFKFKPTEAPPAPDRPFPVQVSWEGESLTITGQDGLRVVARLIAPARATGAPGGLELVESNAFFRWERRHLPGAQWPRVIEVRRDALGTVTVVAHLQRNLPDDGYAPEFGWRIESDAAADGPHPSAATAPGAHSFANGEECSVLLGGGGYRLYHPMAPHQRRGKLEVQAGPQAGCVYRSWRSTAADKVPMQPASWRRAEFVLAPAGLAELTPTLEYPQPLRLGWRAWDALYGCGPPLELGRRPELAAALRYHHEAVIRSLAHGDDWGNVTGYSDSSLTGGPMGMNRLNHCAPIFAESWRSGDRRLRETALLWCDNFHDQSIWWGPGQTGGTRYNNIRAQNRVPPDDDRTYMWRSNDAVHFCTKGYDAFLLAFEETGDPRMLEALEAQVRYAAAQLHVDQGECRNIGDVRDFVRLYQFTGQRHYLDEARRLFRELRTKLSTGDLFSQGGQPLEPALPFIEDDEGGYRHPFAKPYIIGYALAGLPEFAPLAPREPKLRAVIQAVADFLARSQDPLGGWRYPHPRSSHVILSQGLEHAWQLVQADRLLGPQRAHLDAIERVLRQRLLGWRRTGQVLNGLGGWELATGRVQQRAELYRLYATPEARDFTRDYAEGRLEFGSSAPEGLVYFPEVLAFYLKHRPAARLLAPPRPGEPLGKVLERLPADKS